MVVSFAVTDYAEGGVLALVILFNTSVGFVQEFRAEKTMDALRRMASPSAKTIREGIQVRISSGEVVPGDLLTFEVGDIIPADCRLAEVLNLEVDEALLTGEAVPSMKIVEPFQKDKDLSIGDRTNIAEIDNLEELPLVIARCTPSIKVRMIEALQRRGKFAAMTGDGVNHAPSLKKAGVGIAMGAGSDVAKQSSEIVLTDNNFATIVNAVGEGRRIFANIKKFVLHLLSTNVGQVGVLICGLGFKDREGVSVFPLSPVQILFFNLVTGTPPAMSLGIEKASSTVMQVGPQLRGLFTKELILDIFVYGFFISSLVLVDWVLVIYAFGNGDLGVDCNSSSNLMECKTIFSGQVHCPDGVHVDDSSPRLQLSTFATKFVHHRGRWPLQVFDNKLMVISVFVGALLPIPTIYIPTLNTKIFKQEGMSWEWAIVVVSVIAFFWLSELYKLIKRHAMRTPYIM